MKEPDSVVTTLIKPPLKAQRPNAPTTTEMNFRMRNLGVSRRLYPIDVFGTQPRAALRRSSAPASSWTASLASGLTNAKSFGADTRGSPVENKAEERPMQQEAHLDDDAKRGGT
jgi:hypothetical protein